MYYIYRHIRLDKNEVFYIGKGTYKTRKGVLQLSNIYARANDTCDRNRFWNNIVKKTKYKVEIVIESDNINFINEKEIEFIKLYGRKDLKKGTLCNLTDGGDGGLGNIPSKETRLKMSIARKGKPMHENTRISLYKANKGKKLSKEHIEFLRVINTGKKASIETRAKLSEKRRGYKHSEETRNKIRKSNTGKVFSQDRKDKISKSKIGLFNMYNHPSAKKVINTDTNEVYASLKLLCHIKGYKYDTMREKLTPNGRAFNNTIYKYL